MKYPEDFINKIICGDCLEVMKDIPDNSIDLVVTDPPYGINKKDIKGDESLETYRLSLPEIFRVLKKDSFFTTFCSICKLREFLNSTVLFDDEGFFFDFVWIQITYYNNIQRYLHIPIGRSKISLCLIFKKGNPKQHKKINDITEYSYGSNNPVIGHPALKPEEPIKFLVHGLSRENQIILDPFLGSGTTAVVCKKLNRKFIGIEIFEKYCKIAEERLKKVPKRLDKFM